MRALVIAALCVAAAQAPPAADVVVVSGKLAHHALTNDLFHIDALWLQVAPGTLFHRWLSQAINHEVAIIVSPDPDRWGDRDNIRILRGTLMHETAPSTSPIVHEMFLRDERLGATSAVTFETDDQVIAAKFDAFDGRNTAIVIEMR
jgi:hypothetical protein